MAVELIVIVLACLALGCFVQAIAVRRDRRRFPPTGTFVNGLHARRAGAGEPAVVFEAGLAASSLNWSAVQPAVAAFRSTVSYDRPGVGWSPSRGSDLSLATMADDLRHLTRALDLPRPFVLVAHSFGAYIVRAYAHRFREDVAALVLVDPITPEEWMNPRGAVRWRLWRATVFSYLGASAAAVGLVRLGLWGLLRRGGGDAGPLLGLSKTLRRVAVEVAKLPAEVVPSLRARWSEPQFFTTMAKYVRWLPACAAEAARQPIPIGLPVTVLSSARQPPDVLKAHRAFATDHVVVEECGHWIQLEQPELVAGAILAAAPNAGHAGVVS